MIRASTQRIEYDEAEREEPIVKEKHLWRQVIVRAVLDYAGGSERQSSDYRSARRWLFANTTEVFSFRWACELLTIDYAMVIRFAEALPDEVALRRALKRCVNAWLHDRKLKPVRRGKW